jgi:hypothetical protein
MQSESYQWKIYFFRTNNESVEVDEKIEKIKFLGGINACTIEDVDSLHLNSAIITWLEEFGMTEIACEVGFQIELSALNPNSSDWRKLDRVAEGIRKVGPFTRSWTLYCEKSIEEPIEIVQMHPKIPNPSQIWIKIKELDTEPFSWFIDQQMSIPDGHQMTLSTWVPNLSDSIKEEVPKFDVLFGMPPPGGNIFLS